MRSFIATTYSIERLVASGDKSTYSALGTGEGHFRPLDEKASQINNLQIGTGFKLTVEGIADIRANDRLTIGSDVFEVQGVKYEAFGSHDFKEVILEKKK